MKTINFDNYEVLDLQKFLERMKKQLQEEKPKGSHDHFNSNKWDLQRIEILLKRIQGNDYKPDYEVQRKEYRESIGKVDRRGRNEPDFEIVEDYR